MSGRQLSSKGLFSGAVLMEFFEKVFLCEREKVLLVMNATTAERLL